MSLTLAMALPSAAISVIVMSVKIGCGFLLLAIQVVLIVLNRLLSFFLQGKQSGFSLQKYYFLA
jgi:hypothetical protein